MTVRPSDDLRLYMRLLERARRWWPQIVAIFLVGLLSSPLALLTPLPVKIAVDSVLGSVPMPGVLDSLVPDNASDSATLVVVVGLVLVVALLVQLQEATALLLRTYTGERMLLDFRADLFRHLQRLSFSYADKRGTADLLYRIQYDAPAIQLVAIDAVIPFVSAAVTIAGMLFVAARIDLQLAVIALGICPALLLSLALTRQRVRRQSRMVKRLESSALAVVQEGLGAIRVVKAFVQEDRETARFVDRSLEGLHGRLRLVFAQGGYGLLVATITAAGTGAILFIGVRHVQAGVLTLGNLLLVLGYLTQLYAPLKSMSNKAVRLQSHLASAERAFAVLDEVPEVTERRDARPLARANGAVVLDHVRFEYEPGVAVLEDISLEVQRGTAVGISGETGVGKTTLVSLLTRFYDPTDGRILLDGVDLRDYKLSDLRNQFAIVLQDPVLFSTSIAENIAYGRPDAGRGDIIAAAESAGAHEFIQALPDGYDTQVGERGMRLSGGERQRIGLARAFLKDAPILILDEPTSSVDMVTEAEIMEALAHLIRGRTAFIIAHRTSTLDLCDLRVEIEDGGIASIAERVA
jgi:ATP-binding cassette subfamily B protein